MRTALISDIHANAPALREVLSDINRRNVDNICCAGDVVGYNSFPNKTIKKINEHNVRSVRGNHDEAVLTETPSDFSISAKRAVDWTRRKLSNKSEQYLEKLKYNLRFEQDGVEIYLTHGSPIDNLNQYVHKRDVSESRLNRWFDDIPDVVILGHTHRQFTENVNDTIVVNPGSVGQPRDGDPRAAYAIIDTEKFEVNTHRIEYDIDEVANRTQAVLPRKLADRLYEGR